MKEILYQAWQLLHSWATNRPVLFVMMNIMIGGIVVSSARLRDKTTNAEGNTNASQASLFTRVMSRTFSSRSFNYGRKLRDESMAPADYDHRESQYEDEYEDEGGDGYEVKEENDSGTREEEEEKDKSSGAEEIKAEIQEKMKQESKYEPPRIEKPSLSQRRRGSSRVPPGEGSSGGMVALSASSGEISGAASSSTRQIWLQAPPIPSGLRKTGSFLSSFVSFGRGSDRYIPPSTGVEGASRDKKQAETKSEANTTEVDTEAEDFIRKFRNQLKLQRLQSILQRQ